MDHCVLARAAAVAWAPGDRHAEGGGDDIEALGNILTDLVEHATAAGAGLILDIDNLFDTTWYSNSFSQLWVQPGTPRNARVTASFAF